MNEFIIVIHRIEKSGERTVTFFGCNTQQMKHSILAREVQREGYRGFEEYSIRYRAGINVSWSCFKEEV